MYFCVYQMQIVLLGTECIECRTGECTLSSHQLCYMSGMAVVVASAALGTRRHSLL